MAAAAIAGRAGLAELSDAFVQRDDVQRFMTKVSIATTEATDADAPAFAPEDKIAITLANGEVLDAGEIRYARGHAKLPLTTDDMWRKFSDCVRGSATDGAARELFGQLQEIDALGGIAEFPTLGRA